MSSQEPDPTRRTSEECARLLEAYVHHLIIHRSVELELDDARELAAVLLALVPDCQRTWPGYWGWIVELEHERLGSGTLRLIVAQHHARHGHATWDVNARHEPGALFARPSWEGSARWDYARRRFFAIALDSGSEEDRPAGNLIQSYLRAVVDRHHPHHDTLDRLDPWTLHAWCDMLRAMRPDERLAHMRDLTT